MVALAPVPPGILVFGDDYMGPKVWLKNTGKQAASGWSLSSCDVDPGLPSCLAIFWDLL